MRYFSWNHTHLIFSSLIIIFGNLLVAFFHTQITIVLNRQDHIISYSLLRYVDNSIISFHHHKIVQIWLTTMLKSLWFDLINFLVSWFFLVSLVIFVSVFGTFEQLVTPSDLVRDLIDTTDTTENEIYSYILYDIFKSIIKYCWVCNLWEKFVFKQNQNLNLLQEIQLFEKKTSR